MRLLIRPEIEIFHDMPRLLLRKTIINKKEISDILDTVINQGEFETKITIIPTNYERFLQKCLRLKIIEKNR